MSAGTGVASIALAHLGAAHVVATDLLPLLPLIENNAYTLNHIPKSRLVAKELSWGNMPQCEQILKEHGPFDYILISDVIVKIYEPLYAALIATIDAVCSDATKVIMAVELRNPEDTVTFFRQLKETGRLTFSMIAEDKVEEMYRAPELALFEIRRVDATS
jgi:predicted nicotinamide N-methyase